MAPMIHLAVATLCSVSMAATPVTPKRANAIGSAKEDEPCLAGSAGAELAFIRALVWAFEPAPIEIRSQAIEDLGLLGDPRALNPLATLSLDPNESVARAAVRAVATIRHPRAEEILSNLVRHPHVPLSIKQLALAMLPYQNTPSALRFIRRLAGQTTGGYELLQLARTLAATLPPAIPSSPASTSFLQDEK